MSAIKSALSIAGMLLLFSACSPQPEEAAGPGAGDAGRKPLYYRNPMDAGVTSEVPRKDHMGMDYIPVYADEPVPAGDGALVLSSAMVNNLGVRTAPVQRGQAVGEVRVSGLTAWDERGRVEVRVRTEGYVERLAVRAVGERVRRGQALFSVYAPTLAAAQREFVVARASGDEGLIAASAMRLRALGLDDAAIAALSQGKAPAERVTYHAPRDGVVAELGVREGGLAVPGSSALTLTPIDKLWVVADVPEAQAAGIGAGAAARIGFTAVPGRDFESEVLEVLPEINAATRTVQLRLSISNAEGQLAAGMVANVRLQPAKGKPALMIPAEALIRTGDSERVIIALGEGRFAPRAVTAGRESGEQVEILAGLDGAELVVTSGQFMIDSESRVRSSLARFDRAPAPGEAGHPPGHGP